MDNQQTLSNKIVSKNNMQAGAKTYYDVLVLGADGKNHILGKRMPSRRAADRLADLIFETVSA